MNALLLLLESFGLTRIVGLKLFHLGRVQQARQAADVKAALGLLAGISEVGFRSGLSGEGYWQALTERFFDREDNKSKPGGATACSLGTAASLGMRSPYVRRAGIRCTRKLQARCNTRNTHYAAGVIRR